MKVPRLGVKVEVQLPAYPTATEIQGPSYVWNLHHSSWQYRILNPLSETRDWTYILMDTSQVRYCWAMMGTPEKYHLKRTHTQTHTQWDKAQNVKKNNNSFKTNWHSKKYYIIPAI